MSFIDNVRSNSRTVSPKHSGRRRCAVYDFDKVTKGDTLHSEFISFFMYILVLLTYFTQVFHERL